MAFEVFDFDKVCVQRRDVVYDFLNLTTFTLSRSGYDEIFCNREIFLLIFFKKIL